MALQVIRTESQEPPTHPQVLAAMRGVTPGHLDDVDDSDESPLVGRLSKTSLSSVADWTAVSITGAVSLDSVSLCSEKEGSARWA
jgi:hypothetical protein